MFQFPSQPSVSETCRSLNCTFQSLMTPTQYSLCLALYLFIIKSKITYTLCESLEYQQKTGRSGIVPPLFPSSRSGSRVSYQVLGWKLLLCYFNLGNSFPWCQTTSSVHLETLFLLSCILSQRSLERTIVLFLRRSSHHNIHLNWISLPNSTHRS